MTYYAQFAEDRELAAIFPPDHVGYCVEVGANDGRFGSNTLHFEERGWDCVLVEPNPLLCERLRRERKGQVFECGASDHDGEATLLIAEGADHADGVSSIGDDDDARSRIARFGFSARSIVVRVRTLDDILAEASVSRPIDFVSIDVEGLELAVLRGMDLARWRPRFLIVEDNATFSDEAVSRHLAEHGYRAFKRTGVNDWYACVGDEVMTPAALKRYADARRDGLARASRQRARAAWRARIKARLEQIPGLMRVLGPIVRAAGI